MGLTDEALARLGRRHAEERTFVRTMTRRFETAVMSADRGRDMIAAADADRARLIAEWATTPGWTVTRVAEHVGLSEREVSDAVKAERRVAGTDSPGGAHAKGGPARPPARRRATGGAAASLALAADARPDGVVQP